MLQYVLLLTIQCHGGYWQQVKTLYNDPLISMSGVEYYGLNNKYQLNGHKKCYISEVEWYSEWNSDEKQDTNIQE